MGSLSARRGHGAFPGHPGLREAEPSTVPPASPTSKPCSPRETVLPTAGFPVTVSRFSRVCPLRSLLLPRLGSSTRPAPRDRTRPFARRLRRATRRTSDPSSRVSPPQAPNSTRADLVDETPAPYGLGRTASRRRLLLSWPWTAGRTRPALTFRASKYVESGVFSAETPASLGFLASSPASWLRRALRSWLLPKDSPAAWDPVSGHPTDLRTLERPS
jgi:hypothetical protein